LYVKIYRDILCTALKKYQKPIIPKKLKISGISIGKKKDFFTLNPILQKKPYTIVITPPPNITGILHLGHVLNNSIQDIYIRYKRMLGFNACWVPGTDHASIATESKVVQYLKTLGIEKKDISREEFLGHCRDWQKKYGGIIIQATKKLGVSCDWERETFYDG
jgi:valyl-tRNA synthetase